MRLSALVLTALIASVPQAASAGQSSPHVTALSQKRDAGPDRANPEPAALTTNEAVTELPVSIERIRAGLIRPTPTLLRSLEIKPDFIVYIQEREHIQAILNTLDFKLKGIVTPPGGLYAYQQQQVVGNKISNPLGQPYAAFSGGELITLALQGLAQRYLGGKISSALSSAARSYAEHAAEREVARAIAEYCAARPDSGESLQICRIEAMRR
jgi:hypothetical protein